MEIIRESGHEKHVEFRLNFNVIDDTGCSYSFLCDEDGNVNTDGMAECARENYEKCLSGTHSVAAPEVVNYSHSYYVAAVGRCECGEEVYLDGFTNTCECGRDYNSAGQLLAHRSQWGLDTGESLSDILSIH